MNKAIVLFARSPELGKVKSRLAVDLGEQKALDVYIHLLTQTMNKMNELKHVHVYVFFSGLDVSFFDVLINAKFIEQTNGDLGERMLNAFELLVEKHDSLVMIGSDCYDLKTHDLKEAFDKLRDSDLVLGPSSDGGYYLIGMKEAIPSFFRDINWGTSTVFNETMKIANKQSFDVSVLSERNDLDDLSDYRSFLTSSE